MADRSFGSCSAEFEAVTPKGPWNEKTSARDFEPLINLIEAHTQSDMLRRVGKYAQDDDYYDMATALHEGKGPATKTFANGVTASVTESNGVLTRLELTDKAASLHEVSTFNPITQGIETDKVDYCGVSRERKFSEQGEYFRSYRFAGGSVDNKSGIPEFRINTEK